MPLKCNCIPLLHLIDLCHAQLDRTSFPFRHAFFVRKNQEIINSAETLEKCRKNIELMAKGTYSAVSYLLELSRKAPELFENGEIEDRRKLIEMVLSNLELQDEELRWKFKKPYDTMAICNENANWLGMRDSNCARQCRPAGGIIQSKAAHSGPC